MGKQIWEKNGHTKPVWRELWGLGKRFLGHSRDFFEDALLGELREELCCHVPQIEQLKPMTISCGL